MDGSAFRGMFEGLILICVGIGVCLTLVIGTLIYFGHAWFSTHKITVEKKPTTSLVVTNTVTNVVYVLYSTNK